MVAFALKLHGRCFFSVCLFEEERARETEGTNEPRAAGKVGKFANPLNSLLCLLAPLLLFPLLLPLLLQQLLSLLLPPFELDLGLSNTCFTTTCYCCHWQIVRAMTYWRAFCSNSSLDSSRDRDRDVSILTCPAEFVAVEFRPVFAPLFCSLSPLNSKLKARACIVSRAAPVSLGRPETGTATGNANATGSTIPAVAHQTSSAAFY